MTIGRALPTYTTGIKSPASWGMALVILTEGIFFSLLFTSYFYIRDASPSWPQGHLETPELRIPIINTFILLGSSIPVALADVAIRRGSRVGLGIGYLIAFVMGAIFLALQVHEYGRLPFGRGENAYASFFYLITGFHGAHVAGALLINAYVQAQNLVGLVNERRHLVVQNASLYWHFVDVVWVFVFAVVYVSPHLI
jgi:cytochrome c oxidase subunit 3